MANDVKEVTPETMQVQMVPMNLIDAESEFNARQMTKDHPDGEGARDGYKQSTDVPEDASDASALAASMKKNGLRQPVLAMPDGDGRYKLVAGFRRFTAATALGWTHIACVVQEMDEVDAFIANLEENVQRENLSPGEIADRCIFLREEHELEGGDIATRLHLSKSYINNLMRMAEGLHKEIWAVARSGRTKAAPPQRLLLKWVALDDKTEQLAEYQKWASGGVEQGEGEEDGEGEGEGGDGETARTRASMTKLEALREALFAAKKGDEYTEDAIKLALSCVDFACGRRKNPPVTVPEKPKKGAKEATAEN